jgi:hypothetical protein
LVLSRFIPARIKTTLHVHTYTLWWGEGVEPNLTKDNFLHFKITMLNRVTFFMPSEFRIVRKLNIQCMHMHTLRVNNYCMRIYVQLIRITKDD